MHDVTFANKIYINIYFAFLYLNEFEPLLRMIPLQLAGDFVCEKKNVDFEQKIRKQCFEFFFLCIERYKTVNESQFQRFFFVLNSLCFVG